FVRHAWSIRFNPALLETAGTPFGSGLADPSYGSSSMNIAAIDHLIAAYSRVSSANKTKLQRLKVVLARFHEQGIDFILLKRADLIPRLYGVPRVHPTVDLDLLAHDLDPPT